MLEVNPGTARPLLRALAAALVCAAMAGADEIDYSGYVVGDNARNSVATTSFSLAKTLWNRTKLLLDVELDQTTVPPLDVVTGASRPQRQSAAEFRKNRGQIIGGIDQGIGDNTRLLASYYFSQEVDYHSQAGVVGITREFLQKNFTVTLRGQYTLDSVGEILSDGSIRYQGKETHQGSLILTQLLSPTSLIRLGGDGFLNQGQLGNPYRKLLVPRAGSPVLTDTVSERVPEMRYRQDVWAEFRQYMRAVEGAFILNYRYYWDDWNLSSHAVSLKLHKYITPDWVFSPEYRYYEQTAADYGDYAAGNPDAFASTDPKLDILASHAVQAGLTCYLRTFSRRQPTWDFLNNSSLGFLYFHYFNDALPVNYSADVFLGRIQFTF